LLLGQKPSKLEVNLNSKFMKIYLCKDSTVDLALSKVVEFLSSKCTFVEFEELSLSFQAPDSLVKHPKTHRKYLPHLSPELDDDDFIILATDIQYDNNYFYEEEDGLVILSFFGWEYLTSLPKENGLVYFICGMLIDEIVPYKAVEHVKRQGCVNDFLYNKTRVDDGMRKGHLCNDCKKYIKNHKLSEFQSRLFDDINAMLKELAIASKDENNVISKKENTVISNYNVEKQTKLKSPKNNNAASVFISYSHKDEKDLKRLESHLKILQRLEMISTWTDRNIDAGDDWRVQIDKNLNNSQIILMLISSNFLASDYCYEKEMKTAIAKHNKSEADAIAIILRDCIWELAPFSKLKVLPQDGKSIQSFEHADKAYASIAREITKIIDEKYR
jgi:hypothetical protein